MLKNKKRKIGMVHGVFDIIHFGHILYFKEAKSKVDYLIVSVTSDEYVNKGPGKPIFALNKRLEVLKSIKYIDEVVVSKEKTAIKNITRIKPDLYIKGKDYKDIKSDISKQIIKEKKAVEKYGGKLLFTNSELHSSSSIANDVFNYINEDIRKILNSLNKKLFESNLLKLINTKTSKKILVMGDPILDILRFVEPSGKSNKSNVISTKYINEEINAGGTLLAANFLSLFCKNIYLFFSGSDQDLKLIKKYLNKNIKIIFLKTNNKIIKKIRYIDKYSKNRLFQNNFNEKSTLLEIEENKIINKIKNIQNNFDEILFFDYGYFYSSKKIINLVKKFHKKITINCQSNSYNFGFNIADKYKVGKTLSMDEAEYRLVSRNKEENLLNLIKKNKNKFNQFSNLIITQGKKGCYLSTKNKIYYVPCVVNISIDSTGSGDIFLSMFFITQIYKKFSLIESLILAHIAAGLHANQLGNRFNVSSSDIYKILCNINK